MQSPRQSMTHSAARVYGLLRTIAETNFVVIRQEGLLLLCGGTDVQDMRDHFSKKIRDISSFSRTMEKTIVKSRFFRKTWSCHSNALSIVNCHVPLSLHRFAHPLLLDSASRSSGRIEEKPLLYSALNLVPVVRVRWFARPTALVPAKRQQVFCALCAGSVPQFPVTRFPVARIEETTPPRYH